ncbi:MULTISPECIES: hypothetical protein [unclassified Bacillus (in: firmicutes)]|uniref:hypothetical protein n=1 Tax=unclassified Bacillus (in: firmicutes) TaxID=185979 RepID=UPI001BE9570A|nr:MULTISPECIES: hypothetical protein [unclassified Bacillus (in: firmicutes)]
MNGIKSSRFNILSKNYLGTLYKRTAGRKGKKKAAIVVAHAMLRIAYYILTRKHSTVQYPFPYSLIFLYTYQYIEHFQYQLFCPVINPTE